MAQKKYSKKEKKKKQLVLTENEKKEKKLEGELPKKSIRLRENKELIIILIAIAIFFAAFLGPYLFVQNQKTFTYANVEWQIEQYGEETLYHTRFGKYFSGKFYGNHNTFFRNDPRKNNIPIEVEKILIYPTIIISQGPEVLTCERQILVTDALNQITLAIPFIKERIIAVTDEDLATEINRDYITCDNKPLKSTLIQVELGDESKVTEQSENNCYFITIKNCEDNMLVAEKLILEIIETLNQEPISK